MPTYDYICSNCDLHFEAIRKIAEREHASCPDCGHHGTKQISAPLVALDGTDPSMPGAYMKWGRDRQKRIARESEN